MSRYRELMDIRDTIETANKAKRIKSNLSINKLKWVAELCISVKRRAYNAYCDMAKYYIDDLNTKKDVISYIEKNIEELRYIYEKIDKLNLELDKKYED